MPGSILAPAAKPYVTARPPIATDDSAAGRAVGDSWTVNRRLWSLVDSTAGRAIWQDQGYNDALWLDRVTGPTSASLGMAAYGVVRVRRAYAGNAFQVKRASDNATLNIGFIGDVADWGSADAFGAGTTLSVVTWYDQSGNGNDLTQATLANAPLSLGNSVNGVRSISFPNGPGNYLSNSTMQNQFLTHSAVFVGRLYSATENNAICDMGAGVTQFFAASSNAFVRVNRSGSGFTSTLSADTEASFLAYVQANAGNITTIYSGDQSGTAGGTFSDSTMTGMIFGDLNASWGSHMEALAFFVYPRTLTGTEVSTLRETSRRLLNWTPQVLDNILYVGDSITAGRVTTHGIGFPHKVGPRLNRPYKVIDCGWPSGTAVQQLGIISTLSGFTKANVRNVGLVYIGTNDLAANGTAATLYSNTVSILSALRSSGRKCAVATLLPRTGTLTGGQTGAGFETARLAYNALLRSNLGTIADALVDFGGDPVIGQLASIGTYIGSDGVHPTDAGHECMASIALPVMTQLTA